MATRWGNEGKRDRCSLPHRFGDEADTSSTVNPPEGLWVRPFESGSDLHRYAPAITTLSERWALDRGGPVPTSNYECRSTRSEQDCILPDHRLTTHAYNRRTALRYRDIARSAPHGVKFSPSQLRWFSCARRWQAAQLLRDDASHAVKSLFCFRSSPARAT